MFTLRITDVIDQCRNVKAVSTNLDGTLAFARNMLDVFRNVPSTRYLIVFALLEKCSGLKNSQVSGNFDSVVQEQKDVRSAFENFSLTIHSQTRF